MSKINIKLDPIDERNYSRMLIDFNTDPFKNMLIQDPSTGEIIVMSVDQAIKLAQMIMQEYGNE